MNIIIDNRENKLYDLFKNTSNNHTILKKNLELGDIQIHHNNLCKIIIERKSINDLAASINDGRYKEQSHRLSLSSLHNHTIFYIIEGNINTYSSKYNKITKNTLHSAIISLNYYQGFSIWNTKTIEDTCNTIIMWCDKIIKNINKPTFYDTLKPQEYTECIKISKKSATSNNINNILLMQLPGISSKISNIILNKYNNLFDLLSALKDNPACLDNITYETNTGKTRKINKNIIVEIKKLISN